MTLKPPKATGIEVTWLDIFERASKKFRVKFQKTKNNKYEQILQRPKRNVKQNFEIVTINVYR